MNVIKKSIKDKTLYDNCDFVDRLVGSQFSSPEVFFIYYKTLNYNNIRIVCSRKCSKSSIPTCNYYTLPQYHRRPRSDDAKLIRGKCYEKKMSSTETFAEYIGTDDDDGKA